MKRRWIKWIVLVGLVLTPQITWAMHIMEGFLPVRWSIIWSVVSLPFLIIGLKGLGRN